MPMPNDIAKMLVRPAIDTTPAEVLRWLTRAQDHIREPQFWCRGYAALDKNDLMVAAADPAAVQRCAIGAVYADSPESSPGDNAEAPVVRQAIDALNRSAAAVMSLRPPPIIPVIPVASRLSVSTTHRNSDTGWLSRLTRTPKQNNGCWQSPGSKPAVKENHNASVSQYQPPGATVPRGSGRRRAILWLSRPSAGYAHPGQYPADAGPAKGRANRRLYLPYQRRGNPHPVNWAYRSAATQGELAMTEHELNKLREQMTEAAVEAAPVIGLLHDEHDVRI